jgi:c-di-AMP phosphodiesterase-like protein
VKHAAAEIVVEAATHHLKLEAIEPIEASALAHGMWHLTKNGGDEAGAQAFADKTRPIIAARLGRKWP